MSHRPPPLPPLPKKKGCLCGNTSQAVENTGPSPRSNVIQYYSPSDLQIRPPPLPPLPSKKGQSGKGVPSNPHIPTYAYIDYLVPSNQPFNTLALRPSINIAN